MPKLHFHLATWIAVSVSLLTAGTALAQDDRWFRVELLVFSHESGQTTEQWEPTPALSYPGAARFLINPKTVDANLEQYPAASVVDEFGRQIITLPAEPGADNRSAPAATPNEGLVPPTPIPTGPATPDVITAEQTQLLPTPFIALPAGQREFRGKAAYMQRSGRYRTLFHETWVQPVADQGRALPIVLDRSGDTGQWPLLQGSVKLYLSRYLHLETNLWLNTPGEYLPGVWRMPAPPLGPPSLIVVGLPEPELDDTIEEATDIIQEQEVLGPVYPYRHAVLLQQARRMRSTEVHYIDHPLLGVVAKLTPLTPEELETLAEAEAGGD